MNDRAQSAVRALLVLIVVVFGMIVLVTIVAAPLLEFLSDIFTNSQAVADASWIDGDGSSLVSTYRFVALVIVPLTATGFFIVWVIAWFFKTQSRVGGM